MIYFFSGVSVTNASNMTCPLSPMLHQVKTNSLSVYRHITVSADKLPKDKDGFLLESFITSVRGRCTQLKTLYLKRLHIDANLRLLSNIPKSLEFIGLCDVNWTNLPQQRAITSSPFYKIRDRLPNLKRIEILLIRCSPWLKSADIRLLEKSGIDYVHNSIHK